MLTKVAFLGTILGLKEGDVVFCYNGLWKLLLDKDLKKKDLAQLVKLNGTTIAKMGKGQPVSMEVLHRICEKFDCDIGDLVRIKKS